MPETRPDLWDLVLANGRGGYQDRIPFVSLGAGWVLWGQPGESLNDLAHAARERYAQESASAAVADHSGLRAATACRAITQPALQVIDSSDGEEVHPADLLDREGFLFDQLPHPAVSDAESFSNLLGSHPSIHAESLTHP